MPGLNFFSETTLRVERAERIGSGAIPNNMRARPDPSPRPEISAQFPYKSLYLIKAVDPIIIVLLQAAPFLVRLQIRKHHGLTEFIGG